MTTNHDMDSYGVDTTEKLKEFRLHIINSGMDAAELDAVAQILYDGFTSQDDWDDEDCNINIQNKAASYEAAQAAITAFLECRAKNATIKSCSCVAYKAIIAPEKEINESDDRGSV